jgi:hypothetical protein
MTARFRLKENFMEKMEKMHGGSRLALVVIGLAMVTVFVPAQAGFRWLAAVGLVLAVVGLVGRTFRRLHEI